MVGSIAKSDGTAAHKYITDKINSLHEEKTKIEIHIQELENLLKYNSLSEAEFNIVKNGVLSFGEAFENMATEQKRDALRSIVQKIVWDGENIEIYLFGSDNDPSRKKKRSNVDPQCEDSKRYTHIMDTKSAWHELIKLSYTLLIMARENSNKTIYSPLYIHKFDFLTPRKLLESELINIKYKDSKNIPTISEKLRYCRHKKVLCKLKLPSLLM